MAGSAIQAVAGPKSIAARGTERYSCETHRPAHMPNGGSHVSFLQTDGKGRCNRQGICVVAHTQRGRDIDDASGIAPRGATAAAMRQAFQRHIPRTRAPTSMRGPWLADRATAPAADLGHAVRSNNQATPPGPARTASADLPAAYHLPAAHSSHGLSNGTPNDSKSLTLRVTSVRSLTSAVAAKKPSITDRATPLRRLCAIRSPNCAAIA